MCRITGCRSSMSHSSGSFVFGVITNESERMIDANIVSRKSAFDSSTSGTSAFQSRRLPGERRRQIFVAFITVTLLGLVGVTVASSRSRSDVKSRMDHLANKIVMLKREARRAQSLESDERRLEGELNEEREEIQRLHVMESDERTRINSLQEEVDHIKREEKEKEKESEMLLDMVFEQLRAIRNEEAKKLRGGTASEKAVGVLEGHYKDLAGKVQARSKEHVLERFGPGPHRVMLNIEIPEDEISLSNAALDTTAHSLGAIIIEMAPLELMPHTVQVFLDQVQDGLWDGCSFYRNAGHVLQASHKKGSANVTKRFVDSGLQNVKFQEYSADFPHVQHTVGFGGMNAGSVLLINKVDNTYVHGPGGQKNYFGVDDGEPCFGKIVGGFDTLAWLSQTPTSNEKGPDYMDNYVKILSASIL
mmetsp:Transcript_55016/g.164779  ORF Transcript_55016/g.164779 Transcript_55016/m.164779 type:complete len:419 (-) Transcript_55016:932-2188(-)